MRRATADDEAAIQDVLARDPDGWHALEGAPLRPDEARWLLDERPPGFPAERKHTFVVDGVAVLDVLEGYPDPATWYLGLIIVVPEARGRGVGARLIDELSEHARAAGGRALRLAVVVTNTGARRLYDRLGFALVARRSRTSWSGVVVEVDVLELAL